MLLSKAVVSNVVQILNGEAFCGHRFRSYLEYAFFLRDDIVTSRNVIRPLDDDLIRERPDFRDEIRCRQARHVILDETSGAGHNNIMREERGAVIGFGSARGLNSHFTRKNLVATREITLVVANTRNRHGNTSLGHVLGIAIEGERVVATFNEEVAPRIGNRGLLKLVFAVVHEVGQLANLNTGIGFRIVGVD